jgi:hypothetical protein
LSYDGPAADGEVEDCTVELPEPPLFLLVDFGDAPDPTYPTLNAENGASHSVDWDVYLGNSIDWDMDGQPDPNALGDDNDGNDDDDGVVFTSPLSRGTFATVDVTASSAGLLNAWCDFNADGDWADPGEQIFTDTPVVAGVNNLSFAIPIDASTGVTFARFRYDTQGGLSFDGPADDGEVEDYEVVTLDEPPTPTPTPRFRFACSDINGDGLVDDLDLLLLETDWHRGFDIAPVPTPVHPCSDIDGSGFVDSRDLLWLMWDWERIVEPTPTPVP